MTGTRSDVWIPLSDGTRLAATIYRPDVRGPVPVLLEALPYRKDDLTASYRPEYVRFRDEHGYAVARVDLRGSGSSEGIALDEYHPQEQADLVEVVAWLAAQAWSTGAVGMFGTSWSGFNALQVAMHRPPALKAIVATYATDDRATDDVHWMGGALRLLDQVDYPLYMVSMSALPPVPALAGPGWRTQWLDRIARTPPWLLTWIDERPDSAYWRHGSLRPDYGRITCPTLVVAGWADGYRNNTFRTFAGLSAAGTPVHVLAGPWSHMAPSTSVPGPVVDHVAVMARWWDRWLRDVPNGVDDEPPFTVFVRSYDVPAPDAPVWPGRWEAHDAASLAGRRVFDVPLGGSRAPGESGVEEYVPALDVGVTAWNSCAASLPWGQPEDQRPDDARSWTREWELPVGTVVLGHPRVRARIRLDGPRTHLSAKLSLVPHGGGPSLLVDRGLVVVEGAAGEWVDAEVELEATAFELTEGVRLRLALACADWPNTVAPQSTWSAVDVASSVLALPVSAGSPHPVPDLPVPAAAPAPDGEDDDDSFVTWRHGRDVLARTTTADVDHGSSYEGNLGSHCVERYVGHVEVDASGRQVATASTRFELSWPDHDPPVRVTSESRLALTVDPDGTIEVILALDVKEGAPGESREVATRRWHQTTPPRPPP